MALTTQLFEEIDNDFRLIREHLLALADEMATASPPESDYQLISSVTGFAAKEIAHIQHLMKLALRGEALKKLGS